MLLWGVVVLGAVAATATALFDVAVFAIVLRRQTFYLPTSRR